MKNPAKIALALALLSTLSLQGQTRQPEAKLSPRFRMLLSTDPAQQEVARRTLPVKPAGPQRAEPAVGAFVRFRGDANAFRFALDALGASVHTIAANIATAEIPIRVLALAAGLPDVIAIEDPGIARSTADVSVPATGANQIWYGSGGPVPVGSTTRGAMPPPWSGNTGKNVLVGIVDTGIDLTHKDFIDASGNTRIVSVWDQTATKGTPPATAPGYAEFTGNECTSDQINALRQNNDIIVTNPFASSTMTYMGASGGGFAPVGSFTKGHNAVDVATADFDRDGRADVISANNDGTLTFVKNNGGFSFVPQSPITVLVNEQVTNVATGDFNHDGLPDVAALVYSNQSVAILLGKGDGTFQDPGFVIVGNQPDAIAVADLNGDGNADLVVGNYADGTISVLLGDGAGNFADAKGSPFPSSTQPFNAATQFGTYPSGIVVGDFNGDGWPDIAVASFGREGAGLPGPDISIIFGKGDGTFQTPVSYNTGYFAQAIAAGDFNRDGITDLAIQSYSQNVSIFLGNADGTFQTAKNYPGGGIVVGLFSGQRTLVTADFNGDGILDIADLARTNTPTGNYYDQVGLLLGNGDGTFAPVTLFQSDPGAESTGMALGNFHSIACTEVDLDGHGTSAAGLAAGNGSAGAHGPNQTPYRYMGMAPDSKLVVVKTTHQFQDIVDGIAYIENKATQMGLPVVINLSFGQNIGPHDGTASIDTMVDALSGPGQIIVASMGNDGAAGLHTDGRIEDGGNTKVTFTVPANITSSLRLDLWYPGQDQFGVTLSGPGGAKCIVNAVYPNNTTPAPFTNAACGAGTVTAFGLGATNGDQELEVELSNGANPIPQGSWSLNLLGSGCGATPCVNNGEYDVWMTRVCGSSGPCASFDSSDPTDTINAPGSATDAVSVAAYVTKTDWLSFAGAQTDASVGMIVGDLATYSSLGPRRECTNVAACLPAQKPDIAAPGEESMTSYAAGTSTTSCGNPSCLDPDGLHVTFDGTSAAAPHVAGGIALMLSKWGNMTPCQVKAGLSQARADNFTGSVPNDSWGFGKLAVDQAIAVKPVSISVPNVVGMTVAAATVALAAVNLSVVVVYAGSDTVAVGKVISQTPSFDPSCGPVALVISGIPVPQVRGDGLNSASDAIRAANLAVGTLTPIQSDIVPAGQIVATIPGAGTYVAPATSVNLLVSGVTVPAVTNQTKTAATAAILGAGLFLGSVTRASSTTVPAGSIISQNPAAGQVVLPGANVDLVISAIPVPDITGQTLNVGEAVIVADNLVIGSVTQGNSDAVPPGSVISVNPAPGTLVDPGTTIDIVVSGITVPDETGQPEASAESALTGAGLTIGNVTQAASPVVPAGSVISENPGGGAVVGPGTAIDLVISTGGGGALVVPDMTGYTELNAIKTLQNYGLVVGTVTTAASQTVPAGRVISVSPAPGTPTSFGAAVNIVVSSGSGLQSIKMSVTNPTMVPQMVLPLSAIGNYAGNITSNITGQVTWSSTLPGVASVDSNGVITAKTVGQTTITATLGSVSVSVLLNVVAVGACDTSHDNTYSVSDVQSSLNQALGLAAASGNLSGNTVVGVADVQITVNAVMGLGCASH